MADLKKDLDVGDRLDFWEIRDQLAEVTDNFKKQADKVSFTSYPEMLNAKNILSRYYSNVDDVGISMYGKDEVNIGEAMETVDNASAYTLSYSNPRTADDEVHEDPEDIDNDRKD